MRMKGKKPIFNYKDCWSLDNVLSDIIYAGIVKFKEELVDHPFKGHPIDFCDESNEGSDEAFQEWLDTIDKMIYAFDMSQEPDIGDMFKERIMYLYVVKDGHGDICNHYWRKKDIESIESIINMFSSRTPLEGGGDKSNKDAVILSIIPVGDTKVTFKLPKED